METQPDPETLELDEHLLEETKPLHTKFNQLNKTGNTCPVNFGSYDNKQLVLQALCTKIHPKLMDKWGTL